jgi:hypothetical protein
VKIKFTHSHNGELQFDGTTCGTPIVQLGALIGTKTARGEFPTDLKGLEEATETASSAIFAFATNIVSIGELLAYADVDNVSSSALSDIGSLVATLGSHIQTLENMKTSLGDAIERQTKATRKGAAA